MPKLPIRPNESTLAAKNLKLLEEADVLYQQINSNWELVEEKIRTSGVLMPVFIYLFNDDEGMDRYLGLRKIQGKWRICAARQPASDDEEPQGWVPVTDQSLEVRVSYLPFVPRLFEAVVQSNETVVQRLRDAAVQSNDAIAKLGLF